MTYSLLDAGDGFKLEQFDSWVIKRPAAAAVWPSIQHPRWNSPDASFSREEGAKWTLNTKVPEEFYASFEHATMKCQLTDFGHVGVFPEHLQVFQSVSKTIQKRPKLLHLFAHTGLLSLLMTKYFDQVCHVDASKKSVNWAKENQAISNLETAPIRWIVDDVFKFLKREVKRENFYDAVILDPPSFGRGSQGQVFKIESDIVPLLLLIKDVLVAKPAYVILTCHTPGFTPMLLEQLMKRVFKGAAVDAKEMYLESNEGLKLPSGSFARAEW